MQDILNKVEQLNKQLQTDVTGTFSVVCRSNAFYLNIVTNSAGKTTQLWPVNGTTVSIQEFEAFIDGALLGVVFGKN